MLEFLETGALTEPSKNTPDETVPCVCGGVCVRVCWGGGRDLEIQMSQASSSCDTDGHSMVWLGHAAYWGPCPSAVLSGAGPSTGGRHKWPPD